MGHTPRPIRCLRPTGDTREDHIAWCSPTHGTRWAEIHLDRLPTTPDELTWVLDVLTTRLVPGGRIIPPIH